MFIVVCVFPGLIGLVDLIVWVGFLNWLGVLGWYAMVGMRVCCCAGCLCVLAACVVVRGELQLVDWLRWLGLVLVG